MAIGLSALAIGIGSYLMPEVHAYTADAFVMVVKTDNPGTSNATSFTIPITGAGYNYSVDCNDDGINEITARTTSYTCVYGAAGTYTVAITGTFPRIYFNNAGDRQKLLEVKQWGTGAWTSMQNAFYGAINLHITATDAPNLAGVTNMSGMFRNATSMNEDINHWNTSNIKDMSYLFFGLWYDGTKNVYSAFNQPLNSWDTSAVTNMSGMFSGASAFNQPLTNFNTSAVTNMSSMFSGASAFNQPLTNFNTSAVTDMNRMFYNASAFNQPLTNFNTSAVTNMNRMFYNASAFNQPLNSWDTSAVTNMSGMFASGGYYSKMAFNQVLEGWNTSNVTNMSFMFAGSTAFNQPLNGWNVSSVTNMANMFSSSGCSGSCNGDERQFNQPLDAWDTRNVTDMSNMFQGATAFNRPIGNWDTSKVTNMSYMFIAAQSFNQPLANWNTGAVTNMSSMFYNASAFNQPLTNFNTSAVTDMSGMFSGASAFNQPLTNFNTSAVTDMNRMFSGASAFNQPLTNFNTSAVTDMNRMFSGASAFNQPLTNFNTSAVTNMSGMFDYSGLSQATYGQILANLASQATLQPNVAFGATGVTYCSNEADRAALIAAPNNWAITDGGFCPPTITNPTNLSVVSSTTPTLTGTAKPNRTVNISIDGAAYTTMANASGDYSFTVPTSLASGLHTATVSSTDISGNPGAPTTISFYVHPGGDITLSGAVAAPTLTWSAAPPMPAGSLWTEATVNAPWSARSEHLTVVFNNKLWVMGGYANGTNYNDVWSSPDGVTWTEATSSAPWPARWGHTTTVFNNKLWIFGGGNAGDSYNDVWSSPDGVNWTEVTASAPWPARWGHTTVIFNNKLWVMGGYGNGTEYNDVWSSQDGVTWTQVTANAAWPARDSYAAAAFNGKLWVIGGCATTCNPDGDVWSSPDGVTWTQATPEPLRATTRTSYAQPMAQVFDGKLWLIGGYGENWDYTSDVWYTEDGTHWSLATDKPGWSSRSDHTTAVFNDKLWLIGGVDDGVGNRNDVWSTSLGKVTYTLCWDTVENGCAQTAQTTNSSFTIPSNLAKGTWHFKVTANIPGTQGIGSYTTAAYTVTDPLPVITPLTGKPVIHPVTGAASTVTLAPTLAEASLSVSSYDCSDVKAPTVRLVEPDGLKVPEANVTLLGGVGFSVGCTSNGKSADVSLALGTSYTNLNQLRAYKQTGAVLTDITNQVTFTNQVTNGTTKTVASYNLVDGGELDEDGVANGTLVDPIFIGVINGAGGSLANTGFNIYLLFALAAALLTSAAAIWRRSVKALKRVSFR